MKCLVRSLSTPLLQLCYLVLEHHILSYLLHILKSITYPYPCLSVGGGGGGGVNGTINLIVLHSKRIHVIPRMDWLRKHKVLIDDRRVRPNLPKDKSIEWRS
jgi:hypothetical protein